MTKYLFHATMNFKVTSESYCAKTVDFLYLAWRKANAVKKLDNEKLKSITQMNDFENLEQALNCNIYFTDPASPWQRGLNENSNGFICVYLW